MSWNEATQMKIREQQKAQAQAKAQEQAKIEQEKKDRSKKRRKRFTELRTDRQQVKDILTRIFGGFLALIIVITFLTNVPNFKKVFVDKTHYFSPYQVIVALQDAEEVADLFPEWAIDVIIVGVFGPIFGTIILAVPSLNSVFEDFVQHEVAFLSSLLSHQYVVENKAYEPVLFE